jgi:hemin uptake protein HemP
MEPLHADAGELEIDEIVNALVDGQRVVIATELLGSEHEVTLRHDGTTFYCDTPTTLHKHAEEAEMRECIRNQGYAAEE